MKFLKTIKIIFSLIFVITFVPIVVGLIVGKKFADSYSNEDLDNVEDSEDESVFADKPSQSASVRKPRAKTKTEKEAVLTDRQSEIYKMIQIAKSTDMKPIEDAFKKVSTRTLRRDLNTLVKLGKVKRSGSTKNTRYTV